MTPYVPDGAPSCFDRSAVAHSRGEISIEQYFDNVLPHLSGVVHPEAACSRKRILYHPLSITIQSCLFESNFVVLEDTAPVKELLLGCWNGDLDHVKREAPQTLGMLEAHGIANNIFGTMLCIACKKKNLALLQYCLTLNYNASQFLSESPFTPSPIWNATTNAPDLGIWRLLIENGLLASAGEMRQRGLRILAMTGMHADMPRVELLQDLCRHGLVISDKLLNVAAQTTDPDTMRYLVSKCSLQDLERSNALLMATVVNRPLVELLLDSGMNVNVESAAPHDPFEMDCRFESRASTTPLHNAAEKGDMEVVKLLLARGASGTKRDSHKKTAADKADENGHQEVAYLIRESGGQGPTHL